MDLQGKRVLVIGLARTGGATARFLTEQGASVVVSDLRPEVELKQAMDAIDRLEERR